MHPTRDELSKLVYVSSYEPVTAVWGGKEYQLSKEPIRLQYGVAYHWMNQFQLIVNDVPPEEIMIKQIVNPLELENQGEAFAGIKRKGRPREG